MATRIMPAAPNLEDEAGMTKEQKEAAVNRRMDEMRMKNEAILKRHQEVEADRKAAAVTRVTDVIEEEGASGSCPVIRREKKSEMESEQQASSPPTAANQNQQQAGRGRRPASYASNRRSAGGGASSPGRRPLSTGDPVSAARKSARGRGRGHDKGEVKNPGVFTMTKDETSTQSIPPADPSFQFLADRGRDPARAANTADREQDSRRHLGSYGGKNFDNVKKQMATDQKKPRPPPGGSKTKLELSMTMTGRERQQYETWKRDRDVIDHNRLSRQLADNGEWKRTWDKEKNDGDDVDEPIRTEPARRPAGRIGSGRFGGPQTPPRPGSSPVKVTSIGRGIDDVTSSRGRGGIPSPIANRGRGRPRGAPSNAVRPQRPFSMGEGDFTQTKPFAIDSARAQRPLSVNDAGLPFGREDIILTRIEGESSAKRARPDPPTSLSLRGRQPPPRFAQRRGGKNGRVESVGSGRFFPGKEDPILFSTGYGNHSNHGSHGNRNARFRPRSQEFTVVIPATPGTENLPVVRSPTLLDERETDLKSESEPDLNKFRLRFQQHQQELANQQKRQAVPISKASDFREPLAQRIICKRDSNGDSKSDNSHENKSCRRRFMSESEDDDIDIEQYRLRLNHDQTGLITAAEFKQKETTTGNGNGNLDWGAEVEQLGVPSLDGILNDIDPRFLSAADRREMELCGFRVPDAKEDDDDEMDDGAYDEDGCYYDGNYGDYEDDAEYEYLQGEDEAQESPEIEENSADIKVSSPDETVNEDSNIETLARSLDEVKLDDVSCNSIPSNLPISGASADNATETSEIKNITTGTTYSRLVDASLPAKENDIDDLNAESSFTDRNKDMLDVAAVVHNVQNVDDDVKSSDSRSENILPDAQEAVDINGNSTTVTT